MILNKYIFKDILKVQLICLVILFSIFLCQTIIKTLGMVTSGSVPVGILTELVLYSMPSIGFVLIPLTLYVGIIISLSRMSSESEMVVMKSVGISTARIMRIALLIACFSAVLTGINSLYLLPKATFEQKNLQETAQTNPQYLPIESGKFTEFGDYTIYIQELEDHSKTDKQMKNIYIIKSISNLKGVNEPLFLSATKGHMSYDKDGVQWLSLEKGYVYQNESHQANLKKTAYSTLALPLFSAEEDHSDDTLKSVPTGDLLKAKDLGSKLELQWRISSILACFIFAVIAIPLSMVNPRQGKFARLGPAIILFVCYYLALIGMRNIVNSGKIPIYPGLYLVPIVFFIFVAVPLNIERKRGGKKKKALVKNK